MTHSVNGNSDAGSWNRIGSGGKAPAPAGKSFHHAIREVAGRTILGAGQAKLAQMDKSLESRTVEVLSQVDTYMLERGAGGAESNEKEANVLNRATRDVTENVSKFKKASNEYTAAISKLEKLRDKHGWDAKPGFMNGLQSAEAAVKKADIAVNKAVTALSDAQDYLDIETSAANSHKSVLDGFYNPESTRIFSKQNKEIFETRLEGLQNLEEKLQTRLAVLLKTVATDNLSRSEAVRVGQQLQELGASKLALQTRMDSNKKFHKNKFEPTPVSKMAKEGLVTAHTRFSKAVIELGAARRTLDQAITTGEPPKKAAERQYQKMQTAVSQKSNALKTAESNYAKALKIDRKIGAKASVNSKPLTTRKEEPATPQVKPRKTTSLKEQQPAVKASRAHPPGRQQEPVKTRAASSPQVSVKPARTSIPQYPKITPQTADDIQQAREALVYGRTTENSKNGLLLYADQIQNMKTALDVVKSRIALSKDAKMMTLSEKQTLRLLMNHRIIQMMKDPVFAREHSGKFIDRHVFGSQAQEVASLTRLQTLDKQQSR